MSSDNFKCQEDFFCLRYWYTACHGQNLWHQVNACVGSNWSDSVLFIFVALTNLASDTGPAFAFGMTFFSHVVSLSIRPQIWTIWPVLNGVEFYESAFFLMIPDFFSFLFVWWGCTLHYATFASFTTSVMMALSKKTQVLMKPLLYTMQVCELFKLVFVFFSDCLTINVHYGYPVPFVCFSSPLSNVT